MSKIVPAIIPDSLQSLRSTLARIKVFAEDVQIDIVDGKFVPFTSWPYAKEGSLSELSEFTQNFNVELDLMILAPEEVLDECVNAGARSIVVHLESTHSIDPIIAHRSAHEYKLGLSINNDTPLGNLMKYMDGIDYVQLMGIAEIGSQGQPFDTRVLDRIRTLRQEYPDLLISIDGSVNQETIPQLRDAGAIRFVSGSAILSADDPERAYRALEALASA